MREFCSSRETEAQNIPTQDTAALLSGLITPVPWSRHRMRDREIRVRSGAGSFTTCLHIRISNVPRARAPWPAIIVTPILWRLGQGELLGCNVYVNISATGWWAADAIMLLLGKMKCGALDNYAEEKKILNHINDQATKNIFSNVWKVVFDLEA